MKSLANFLLLDAIGVDLVAFHHLFISALFGMEILSKVEEDKELIVDIKLFSQTGFYSEVVVMAEVELEEEIGTRVHWRAHNTPGIKYVVYIGKLERLLVI